MTDDPVTVYRHVFIVAIGRGAEPRQAVIEACTAVLRGRSRRLDPETSQAVAFEAERLSQLVGTGHGRLAIAAEVAALSVEGSA